MQLIFCCRNIYHNKTLRLSIKRNLSYRVTLGRGLFQVHLTSLMFSIAMMLLMMNIHVSLIEISCNQALKAFAYVDDGRVLLSGIIVK